AEAVARAIHAASSRRDGAFITIDVCRMGNSITELDAPPFTIGGPDPSRLEMADGGTLFIDQVDRLSGQALDGFTAYVTQTAAALANNKTPIPNVRLIG